MPFQCSYSRMFSTDCTASSAGNDRRLKISAIDSYLGLADDGLLRGSECCARLGGRISLLTEHEKAADHFQKVADAFATARSMIGVIRLPLAIYKFASGLSIWEVTSSGAWRKVSYDDNGQLIRIPATELNSKWERTIGRSDGIKWASKRSISIDGIYIEDQNGQYVQRPWIDILVDILILAARLLAPIRLIHSLKIMDLGKHATRMEYTTVGIWGVVSALGLVSSINELIQETDAEKVKQRCWNVLQSGLDLLALPSDCLMNSGNPVLAIVCIAINILAASSLLLKEFVY